MTSKINLIALGAAAVIAAAAGPAGAASSALALSRFGGPPVAFCCTAYDYNNDVGEGCAPTAVTTGAVSCANTYFECSSGVFICGPASLIDPVLFAAQAASPNFIQMTGPDCACGFEDTNN